MHPSSLCSVNIAVDVVEVFGFCLPLWNTRTRCQMQPSSQLEHSNNGPCDNGTNCNCLCRWSVHWTSTSTLARAMAAPRPATAAAVVLVLVAISVATPLPPSHDTGRPFFAGGPSVWTVPEAAVVMSVSKGSEQAQGWSVALHCKHSSATARQALALVHITPHYGNARAHDTLSGGVLRLLRAELTATAPQHHFSTTNCAHDTHLGWDGAFAPPLAVRSAKSTHPWHFRALLMTHH
jgi:hypothetical protein